MPHRTTLDLPTGLAVEAHPRQGGALVRCRDRQHLCQVLTGELHLQVEGLLEGGTRRLARGCAGREQQGQQHQKANDGRHGQHGRNTGGGMIGRLQGRLEDRWQEGGRCGVVIDCAGIGYEVQVPRGWHERLQRHEPALPLIVHIHHVIREDASLLFGFERKDERDLFRMLLGVSGVGPQVAMALASTLEHEQLITAIAAADLARLGKAPGVGRRTAERIVVDLRDKLPQGAADGPATAPLHGPVEGEVERTLAALGYSDDEIRRSLSHSRSRDATVSTSDVDAVLRRCLAWLAREGA